MTSFMEFPDKILNRISTYLNTNSRIQLSRTCTKFFKFFIDNPVTRYSKIDFYHYDNVTKDDFVYYILGNIHLIEHLDISYCPWKKSYLYRIISTFPYLKSINVIGTEFTLTTVSNLMVYIESITSVEVTYRPGTFLRKIALSSLHLLIDQDCHEPFQSESISDTLIDDLQMTVYYPYSSLIGSMTVLCFYEASIKFVNPMKAHEFLKEYQPTPYYCAVETASGVYVSDDVLHDFKIDGSLIDIDTISKLKNNIFSVRFCSRYLEETYQDFRIKVKKLIETKSNINVSLYGKQYCPQDGFNIVQGLPSYKTVRRLSTQACTLSRPVDDKFETMDKIGSLCPDLEMIQIKNSTSQHHCKPIMALCTLNPSYLHPIANLKALKYLSFYNAPYLTIDSLTKILQGCSSLERLMIIANDMKRGFQEALPGILHLSNSLRSFHIEGHILDLANFIKGIQSDSLTSIFIKFNMKTKLDEFEFKRECIMRLPSACPRLNRLTVAPLFGKSATMSSEDDLMLAKLNRIESYIDEEGANFKVVMTAKNCILVDVVNEIGEIF